MKQIPFHLPTKHRAIHILKSTYWFFVGFVFAAIILSGIVIFYFQTSYKYKVIPGVFVERMYIGGKTEEELTQIFEEKNKKIEGTTFTISHNNTDTIVTAEELKMGFDTKLIVNQSMFLGKSKNLFSNLYIILNSYMNGAQLSSPLTYNTEVLKTKLATLEKEIYKEPVDAQFAVENNRVVTFKESSNGQELDYETLEKKIIEHIDTIAQNEKAELVTIQLPVKVLEPETTTEEANDLGIVEKIADGTSDFKGSIPNRIHNVGVAANKVNGILVAPGEEFSFNKNLGDVSKFTGYKEAYVIQNGRTVLGDGGGVCQVSTTLFRAALNAGLPITERHAHAYRVGYYEQNSPMGFDATIYVPTVDFRFKNDTENHILIVSNFDAENQTLVYSIYGKKDDRVVEITKPVVTSTSPPPEPLYQDDPTLPKDVVKQVDYAVSGARVNFKRTVTRGGEVIIDETFYSSYTPWQAVFLRGTKEG